MKIDLRSAFVAALFISLMPSAFAGIAQNARRSTVEGVDVIVYPTAVENVVRIMGFMSAGVSATDDGNPAVPNLTAMMIDRGTVHRDQFSIQQSLDSSGAKQLFSFTDPAVVIQAKMRKPELRSVVTLLAEELRTPRFDPQEFEKVRQQFIGERRDEVESVSMRAQDAFARAAYPAGHANRKASAEELIAGAERARLEDLRTFHTAAYGPARLTLIFVGDVDAAKVQTEVRKAFSGWRGGAQKVRQAQTAAPGTAREEIVALNGKSSVTVLLGQPTGLRYRDSGALALRMGTAVLGSGFTSRLVGNVRDKKGLTYGIGAMLQDDDFNDGSWTISATFAPSLLDQGIASIHRELEKWWRDGVTQAELDTQKRNIIGSYQIGLASTGGIALAIMSLVQRGYDLTWLDDYPKAIDTITLEQVNTAIRRYLNPGRMILVKAGTF